MEVNPFLNTPAPKKANKFVIVLQTLAILTVVLMVLWIVVFEQNQVRGPSMQPTFVTGEFLLTSRLPKFFANTPLLQVFNLDYQMGDVVVFQKPGYEDFVKRVLALPGDKIRIEDGRIYVNGKLLTEEYLPDGLFTNGGDLIRDGGSELTVPAGSYALIGDNRPQSNDSRFAAIGFIKREWIKGKVVVRIWPFEKFTFISQGRYTLN